MIKNELENNFPDIKIFMKSKLGKDIVGIRDSHYIETHILIEYVVEPIKETFAFIIWDTFRLYPHEYNVWFRRKKLERIIGNID